MSLKPSPLKSPAELTAKPVWAPPAGAGEDGAGNGGGAGRSDAAQVDVPHVAGRGREAGQGRAAVNEIGVAGGAAALRGTDQEVVDVVAGRGDTVDVAGVGDRESSAVAGIRSGEDQALAAGLAERRDVDRLVRAREERSGHHIDRTGCWSGRRRWRPAAPMMMSAEPSPKMLTPPATEVPSPPKVAVLTNVTMVKLG